MVRSRLVSCLAVTLLLVGSVVRGDDAKPNAPAAPADKTSSEKKESKASDEQYYELMQVMADTFEQIERNYVKQVDRRRLVDAAIRGMMRELEDPYSNYISPDDLSGFTQVLDQQFTGIGIHVTMENQRLTVMSPLPGSPALKAGIRAGDVITEIDGKTTQGVSLEEAVTLMKGYPGTPVKVGVLHKGEKAPETLTVLRDVVKLASVLGDTYNADNTWNFMLDPEKKIGYVRITTFGKDTTDELGEALTKLTEQGMKGLIIDLRNNPGGLLQTAIQVADYFLDGGVIVSTKGRNTPTQEFKARKRGTFNGFPIAVLVNHYSASASEVVSAALQDHKRAVVVGERTWGKGSVQNVIDLEAGKSALKLTTASYHRPNGKNIHRFPNSTEADEWGVMPDDGLAVKFNDNDLRHYLEYRRARDVLSSSGPPKSDFVDTQLNKAVEYVVAHLGTDPKKSEDKKSDEKKPDGEKTAEKPAENK